LKKIRYFYQRKGEVVISAGLGGGGALSERWRARGSASALIKKKISFSSYIRKFRMEQLQNHI